MTDLFSQAKEHHKYQDRKCSELSDEDLAMGFVKAHRKNACAADHTQFFDGHLVTDECRYFTYPDGWSDHFNMRWFKNWIIEHRPHLVKKLTDLKAFW